MYEASTSVISSALSDSHGLEFTDFWSNISIDKEVLRGVKLREVKPKKYSKPECAPIDISFDIKTTSGKKLSHNRCKCNKSIIDHRGRKKSGKNCPMRIAELAAPSKRHCLDTWRHKGKMLPDYMADRLRQHVMDQKPLVHISDAITCFKSRSVRKARRSTRARETIHKGKNFNKIKLLCAIFGYEITKKLLQPVQTTLNQELQKLSDIVNYDISKLLHSNKKRGTANRKIQNETADKVTIWITTILEESSTKLIMDDFLELEEKEGHIWNIIDDLINLAAESYKSESISTINNDISKSYTSIHSNKSSQSSVIKEQVSLSHDYTDPVHKTSSLDTPKVDIPTINECQSDEIRSSSELVTSVLFEMIDQIALRDIALQLNENENMSLEDFITSLIETKINEILSKYQNDNTMSLMAKSHISIDTTRNVKYTDILPETYNELSQNIETNVRGNNTTGIDHDVMKDVPTDIIESPSQEGLPTDIIKSPSQEGLPTDIIKSPSQEGLPTDIIKSPSHEDLPTDIIESPSQEGLPTGIIKSPSQEDLPTDIIESPSQNQIQAHENTASQEIQDKSGKKGIDVNQEMISESNLDDIFKKMSNTKE